MSQKGMLELDVLNLGKALGKGHARAVLLRASPCGQVQLLLEAKAVPDRRTADTMDSPLHVAARNDVLAAVQALVRARDRFPKHLPPPYNKVGRTHPTQPKHPPYPPQQM